MFTNNFLRLNRKPKKKLRKNKINSNISIQYFIEDLHKNPDYNIYDILSKIYNIIRMFRTEGNITLKKQRRGITAPRSNIEREIYNLLLGKKEFILKDLFDLLKDYLNSIKDSNKSLSKGIRDDYKSIIISGIIKLLETRKEDLELFKSIYDFIDYNNKVKCLYYFKPTQDQTQYQCLELLKDLKPEFYPKVFYYNVNNFVMRKEQIKKQAPHEMF